MTSRLEQQQTLDVESSLVVEGPAPAAKDELGHDHDRFGPFVVCQLVGGRRARACRCLGTEPHRRRVGSGARAQPISPDRLSLFGAEREVDRTCVVDPQRARVVDGTHRGRVHIRDKDADDCLLGRRLGRRPPGRARRRQRLRARLERRSFRSSSRVAFGSPRVATPAKELWDHYGDEGRFAARRSPDLLEHRFGHAERPIEHLELGALVGEAEPAGLDTRIRAAAGTWIALIPAGARRPGEPECIARRLVDRFDQKQRRITRWRRRDDRSRACAEPPLDPAVVVADPVGDQRTSNGIATITIQAPAANFVTMTTAVTTPVAVAPTPLTTAR